VSDALKLDESDDNRRYTYADYLKWDAKERFQLIKGEAFMMASPSVKHQTILRELFLQFGNYLQGKECQVFTAPLDVRLFPQNNNSDDTVVQPDLLVVCDNKKIGKNSINGAPDLVIEIMSPSNSYRELFLKFQYYLEAGIREYWVIDPDEKKVQVHIYENGRYITSIYKENSVIQVTILLGFNIDLAGILN